MPKIKVTVTFLFNKVKGKDDRYYQDKAFDEIYNGDDNLQAGNFGVEEVK